MFDEYSSYGMLWKGFIPIRYFQHGFDQFNEKGRLLYTLHLNNVS